MTTTITTIKINEKLFSLLLPVMIVTGRLSDWPAKSIVTFIGGYPFFTSLNVYAPAVILSNVTYPVAFVISFNSWAFLRVELLRILTCCLMGCH